MKKMCRNCPLPQWSEPIEVEVSSLPAYFAKEQSWNFERLNFGNGTVVDTPDGKSARPSLTGCAGTRLREGFSLKPHPRFPGGRYLLVSEVLYCPGRRYGCTPRVNCSGKRRFCFALCKISIFADKPNVGFVYYAGSHGTGDVSSPDKHRPNKQMLDQLRKLRVEQSLTPSQGMEWCKVYFTENGLDEKLMPTKTQIKSLMKRASMKYSRMRESVKTSPGSGSTPGTSAQYGQLAYAENGDMTTDVTDTSSSYISMSHDGSSINVSSANYGPGLGTLSRMAGSSLQFNTPVSLATSTVTTEQSVTQSSGESSLSKVLGFLARPCVDVAEKDLDKLREHIRILQEENFTRIAQVADLQVEVNSLKAQALDLKEDNLKKAIHIAQLERARRSVQVMPIEQHISKNPQHSMENAQHSMETENAQHSMETENAQHSMENAEHSLENAEHIMENSQHSMENEEIQAERMLENSEQTVVIENSDEATMEVIGNEAVQNTVYQVNVETAGTSEGHVASHGIEASLQDPDVVATAHAIIVSQAVVDAAEHLQ